MIWIILGLYLLYELIMTILYFWSKDDERMGISKPGDENKRR